MQPTTGLLFQKEEKLIITDGQPISSIPKQSSKLIYLKGLNGLRAIAAIVVLISHLVEVYNIDKLHRLGGFGVTIFFTLSGFLITYLLLKETEESGTVSIPKFYIRRILRIWPLYFLYFALVLVVYYFLRQSFNFNLLPYFLLFAPNIPIILSGGIDMLTHYWSLGVEEQFYLFWPLVVKRNSKRLITFCITFVAIFLIAKLFLNPNFGGHASSYKFLVECRFDCMIIGCLGACLFYKKNKYILLLNHMAFQLLAWGIMLLVLLNLFHFGNLIDHEIVSCIVLILILNQISNPKTIISLEKPVLNYLGKISYGIYVFHPLVIALVAFGFKKLNVSIVGLGYITLPILIISLTILFAHLSYYYFESKFLKIKQSYAIVKSTNSDSK